MAITHAFQAKLIWAHELLNGLHDAILEFSSENPCHVVHKFDPESRQHMWRVSRRPRRTPLGISLRLGDVLHNYRSTLDYLIHELIYISGGTATRDTAFPVCEKRVYFRGRSIQRKISGVRPAMRAIIESLQPYKRRLYSPTHRYLLLLDRLRNIDMHRHLNLAVVSLDLGAVSGPGVDGKPMIHSGAVEDGTILARVQGDMDADFHPAFGVALSERGYADGESLRDVTIKIELAVEDILSRLAPFVAH